MMHYEEGDGQNVPNISTWIYCLVLRKI